MKKVILTIDELESYLKCAFRAGLRDNPKLVNTLIKNIIEEQ